MLRKRGFTLIEVLTVIAIIGILSAVILVGISGAQKKGRDGRRIADINQIRLALSLYYDAHNSYPATSGDTRTALTTLLNSQFIAVLPDDPRAASGAHYAYVSTNCSGSTCYGYVLATNLESSNGVLDTAYKGSQAMTVSSLAQNCSTANPQNGYYLYCTTN